MELLDKIEEYWTGRAEGYSQVNQGELATEQREKWKKNLMSHLKGKKPEETKVLDIGTGPGFFAIILAEAGYQVTAVDYTEEMLKEAKQNAGKLAGKIHWQQMDAQNLTFESETFDVVVSRNLTWNLEKPEKAYGEWIDLYKDCPFESVPHLPRHPDSIYLTDEVAKDERGNLIGYFAAVTAMDAGIGKIMEKLEDMGIAEDTLVVFTADNGFSCGHHGFWGKGNATFPLNMYEESVKVPFIVRHPGHIPAGAVCDALVSAYDFMPTLLDYLDLKASDRSCTSKCSNPTEVECIKFHGILKR